MQQINVVGAIIVHEGKVLAAQKGSGPLAGYWEFPGGKVEPGETLHDALVREISEEMACEVEAGGVVESTDYDYPFARIRLTTLLCRLTSGEPVAREHASVRWLSPGELLLLKWAPADLPAVRRISEMSCEDS